ncbi:carboxylate-amine ligase [Noviherbaspirillum massiliense]|uniref:carboxylate-amine ligase n=1 Tax=Noviherbaspirillum massiliense TaxID=1465823 RepID=UPI000316524B|nr:glutamate-cysteine ligase family protein [Noviherbaspirillum massiliense]
MSDEPPQLSAFKGVGIELEYMIVDRESLSVLPVADRLLEMGACAPSAEVDRGMLGWSNEFVLHVIEVKNQRPATALSTLPEAFQHEIGAINRLLESMGARLMPSAMHPWMDPVTETRLWPHQNEAIYRAYDRIFDSRSHGWSNLQSMHINLPFADDGEFARLHAAIRLVLPILPALAASSPFADGEATGCLDYRMQVYCSNSDRVPSIAGMVIPETVSSHAEYEECILAPMYADVAPFDPEGVLRHEWLNSRGAIARFDRNAIEIRVIDTQECVRADLAVAAATVATVKDFYHAGPALREQQAIPTEALAAILHDCIRDADQALITDTDYLRLCRFPGRSCTALELWRHLIERVAQQGPDLASMWKEPLHIMLQHGPLGRRMLRAAGRQVSKMQLAGIFRQLCDCLRNGQMFLS